jgi:hypothetical protein
MKFFAKPVAAAVGLAIISAGAHAQLAPPAQSLAAPPAPTGLYLAVYDSAGNNSELVNLGYDQSVLTAVSGNLTPNSATSPFVTAAAPVGSGNVLQLNFGQISGFGSAGLFTSANAGTTTYMVLDALTGAAGREEFQATSSTTPVTAYSGVSTITQNIQSEIAAWNAAVPATGVTGVGTGDLQDTTGTQVFSVKSGPLNGGTIISGQNFSGSLGSALDFYDITTTTAHKSVITPYQNSTGQGYWFLSSSGDLTYDIPVSGGSSSGGTVPLPPAVWLLGSGLLGVAGIARRRRSV